MSHEKSSRGGLMARPSSYSDLSASTSSAPEIPGRPSSAVTSDIHSGRDQQQQNHRPFSLMMQKSHMTLPPPSRASSAGTIQPPLSLAGSVGSTRSHKRPSSLVSRISPTKMLQIGKKRKAEGSCASETKVSPYPFQLSRSKDGGSTQSVSVPGFFSSYSPVLYFGDVGSFDSILQPSSSPVPPPDANHTPDSDETTPRSGSATPTIIVSAHPSSKGKRAELARVLRKAVKEAKDACRWLNAAGFPQYVQMYEDGQFPINLSRIQVEKDHTFLDQADIDTLIRRLNILNRCADKMDEIRNLRFDESDDESHSRALSDKWRFRRRQKKWSRRSESRSTSSNYGTPQHDTLFSSCEDLLQDNGPTWDTAQSPLMLVSELRGSLTGLDRAVKTYSFMLNEDQVPSIQVQGPSSSAAAAAGTLSGESSSAAEVESSGTLRKMSSAFSSLESEEENEEEDDDYPSSNMENFATGILDTFESNLLKLKDYTTRSLPNVFKESADEYHHPEEEEEEDNSCEVSPLSSASGSTASIAESIEPTLDPSFSSTRRHHHPQPYKPPNLSRPHRHQQHHHHHPLADQLSYDLASPRSNNYDVNKSTSESGGEGVRVEKRFIHVMGSGDEDKRSPSFYSRANGTGGGGGGGHSRMFSGDSLGACSLTGSEYSERDFSGFSSSSPVPSGLTSAVGSRLSRLHNGTGSTGGEQGSRNGRESAAGGEASPLDDITKRISKTSISSTSDMYKKHVSKWHGYQRPHSFRASFRPVRTLIPIEELSVGQISVLRKLCLVKITALMELHKAKTNIAKLLKSKSKKTAEAKPVPAGRRVFGVSLAANVRQTGQALPPTIHHAIDYLNQDSSLETMGLFRRAASKAKVEVLKELMEEDVGYSDFSDFSPYDVADTLKVYFRELPEPLLTSKFSELLVSLQESVPTEELRLPALQGVILLLPDEHREALQVLMGFLRNVAQLSETNQMTPQNLAVCFAPTLFSLSTSLRPKATTNLSRKGSFRRTAVQATLTPEQVASNKEISESVASSHCLTEMICSADKLFKVAADMLQVCRFTHLEMCDPVPYYELDMDRRGVNGFMNAYLDSCVHTVLREARKKFKSWGHMETLGEVEVSCLKVADGVPLRVWRGAVEIDTSNTSVYLGLWADRSLWDHNVVAPKLVVKIDEQTEVFQYSTPSIPPLTKRDHCILRSWQFDIASSSYVLVSTSVSHPQASLQGGIRATHLTNFFLVEPLDNDHCRLTQLCRVDMRGRSADYYNKLYGPYLASTLTRVQDVLCRKGDLQETSV